MTLGYVAQIGDPATYAAANARRSVFYSFPRGSATLVGFLSLMESENTDGPHYDWHEKRWRERKGYLTDFSDAVTGPWTDAGGTGGATLSVVADTNYRINVTTTETLANWSVGERLRIALVSHTGGAAVKDIYARIVSITQVTATTGVLLIRIDSGHVTVTVDNAHTTNEGNLVQSLGTPSAEGSRAPGSRTPLYPIKPGNFTEIIRTPITFTRTQLNQPMFFDEQGLLHSTRRDAAIDHLVQWENALLFGRRSEENVTDTDGTPTVVRTLGGIKWFLEEYEKANGGSLFTYRPGGAALTANTDDGKRIIQGDSSGVVAYATWQLLEERLFRSTMNSSGEKLLLGGHRFCKAFIDHYRAKSAIRITRPFEEEGLKLNFQLQTVDTDYGPIHVKSHPRFNDDPYMSMSGCAVDLVNLKLRPMVGADMRLNTGPTGNGIQDNDFDGRKEEYFAELGFELRFPESHMWFERVSSIPISA